MRPSCPESSHAVKEPVESCGAFAYSRTIRKPGSWHLHRPNFLNRETGMVKCHLPQGTKFICHISWRKHFASRVDYSCSVVHSISYILTSGMGSGPDMSNHTMPSGSWHDICCVKAKRVSVSKIARDCKARKICLKICDICHLWTKCIKILTKLSAFFKGDFWDEICSKAGRVRHRLHFYGLVEGNSLNLSEMTWGHWLGLKLQWPQNYPWSSGSAKTLSTYAWNVEVHMMQKTAALIHEHARTISTQHAVSLVAFDSFQLLVVELPSAGA